MLTRVHATMVSDIVSTLRNDSESANDYKEVLPSMLQLHEVAEMLEVIYAEYPEVATFLTGARGQCMEPDDVSCALRETMQVLREIGIHYEEECGYSPESICRILIKCWENEGTRVYMQMHYNL